MLLISIGDWYEVYGDTHSSSYTQDYLTPGARPTKHISIELEIWWKFRTL